MQNQKFVAPNAANNRTLAEAYQAVKKLNLIGQSTFGIVAIGGTDVVEEADFSINGINPDLPANLEIRCKVGKPASEEQMQPEWGEYQNVDKILDIVAKANAEDAINQLLAMLIPGITSEQQLQRKMSIPGVSAGYSAALTAAWNAA